MRATPMLAGLALIMAACGGEKKADEQKTATPEQAPPAAAAPTATGTTHDVDMVMEGTTYKFVPAELTIKAGDAVRFHNKSGGPHNVSFWPDSIPSGASDALNAGMPDAPAAKIAPLEGPLLTEPESSYTVTFAKVPTGEYKFFCLPHTAFGMKGKIKVQ
jgi:plastocyanin